MERLIEFVISIIHIFRFFHVVAPGRRAICVLLGKYWVRERGPGFYLMFPAYMDDVYEEDVVEQIDGFDEVTNSTKDGKELTFIPGVRRSIHSVRKTVFEVDDWETSLSVLVCAAVYEIIEENDYADLTADFMKTAIKDRISARCTKWGITVREVLLTDAPKVRTFRLLGNLM